MSHDLRRRARQMRQRGPDIDRAITGVLSRRSLALSNARSIHGKSERSHQQEACHR